MEHRKLGKSDLQLPVVTFGAWAIGGLFWGGADDQDAVRAIETAIDSGIDAIDTAPAYGQGHSERLVGKAVAGKRDRVKILTKCGLRWDDESGEFFFTLENTPGGKPVTFYKNVKKESILYECEQSLKRLSIDTIDLYQVHWPSSSAPAEETMEALTELKKQGKIREFAVSNYSPTQLLEALRHGAIVSDQVKYNLLERDIEETVLPFCREHNLGVICYSPMAMGLLTGKVTEDRKFADSDVRSSDVLFSKENRRKVQKALTELEPVLRSHDATPAQLAVAWVIAQPGVTTALVGARNAKQVAENAKAAELKLSTTEVSKIRKIFTGLGNLRAEAQAAK